MTGRRAHPLPRTAIEADSISWLRSQCPATQSLSVLRLQTPLARMIKCGFAPMLWATIMRGQEGYNYAWNRVYNIILRVRAPLHGQLCQTQPTTHGLRTHMLQAGMLNMQAGITC